MSRGFAAAGVGLAALCGILVSYSTLRPELEKQSAERRGDFTTQHNQEDNDTVISKAIMSDLKEAREQVSSQQKGGFAWGIRQAIWGKKDGGNAGDVVAIGGKQQELQKDDGLVLGSKLRKEAEKDGS